jgi:hypothetical protein
MGVSMIFNLISRNPLNFGRAALLRRRSLESHDWKSASHKLVW